ncbi:MAG: sigma-70 family RNA polymerase sigma factor [Bacteroidales bacterium]|nr:sigma-70 family RNA polymerase sigma factor [Bacteroidales bacterium]
MTTARKRHILEEHYLDFYSRAVSILDDEDDAKDAVQEAVVKTLVRIGLRDEVSYCFRATENESINILRRRKRLQRFDVSDDLGVDDRRLGRDLEEGKRLLLPLERKVLELRREHGYNTDEVASQMGVSASTVKRLLAMAEKKMKYIMTHDI